MPDHHVLNSARSLGIHSEAFQIQATVLKRLAAVQDLHKQGLASLQEHLDSLTIQMEGTRHLLDAAAAVETAPARQQMLKVLSRSSNELRHLVSLQNSSFLIISPLSPCCSSAVGLSFIRHGSACTLAVHCRALL